MWDRIGEHHLVHRTAELSPFILRGLLAIVEPLAQNLKS